MGYPTSGVAVSSRPRASGRCGVDHIAAGYSSQIRTISIAAALAAAPTACPQDDPGAPTRGHAATLRPAAWFAIGQQ